MKVRKYIFVCVIILSVSTETYGAEPRCYSVTTDISEAVPDNYPTASQHTNVDVSMEHFELPDTLANFSDSPRRVFFPVRSDDTPLITDYGFLQNPSVNVIIWGNGAAGVNCPDRYLRLFAHWVSYGFVVVQERSGGKIDGSLSIPNKSMQLFQDWVRENSPKNIMPELTIIAAGKSRGGSQAHTFASSRATRDEVDGVLCIGGCGFGPFLLAPPRGAKQPGLYITGKSDWARPKVLQAYHESGPERLYFERRHVTSTDGRIEYGTHEGHDFDPLIAVLTTDWLRCRFQSSQAACDAMAEQQNQNPHWRVVKAK